MQQQGQGGGGSQYRVSSSSSEIAPPFAASTTQMLGATTTTTTDNTHQLQPVVEEASPISSRPPAGNFDELLPATGGGDDDLFGAGDDTDHRGGISGGNRWPRQETLALLKIRSEMDITFRDATLKGPLWEEVSRKLGELGYTRSAKKCKEKFENVQKYYKRTKEGRAGRQDGKSYRFFSELEALHGGAGTATNSSSSMSSAKAATPISIGIGISNPVPVSSVRLPTIFTSPSQLAPPIASAAPVFPHDLSVSMAPATITPPAAGTPIGISFSSTSSSSASESEEDDGDELEAEPSKPSSSSRGRKRKRVSAKGGGRGTNNRMMEFFESLMKQVMQKQESMQQRFLDTIEKREHDRMIREEAWKRQESARLTREQEHMAQDRAIAASRDAAIITFLQKITGQNIQLPTAAGAAIPTTSPIPPPPPATVQTQQQPPPPPPPQQHQQQPQGQQHRQIQPHRHHQSPNSDQVIVRHQLPVSSEVFMAVPEQQVPPQETGGGSGSFDPTSSRWPKVEVLALIKLRSGLEVKYQEAGPKGPLWEEISAGMQRMGYKRSSKRCKEKWENINKYFKKVKESNKSRPEDAKTCPYFHELDALYRRKILGSTSGGGGGDGSSSSSFGNQNLPVQQQQQQQQESMATTSQEQDKSNLAAIMAAPQITLVTESEINKGDSSNVQENNAGLPVTLFGQGSSSSKAAGGGHKKPEDIVKELIEQQKQQQRQQLMTGDYDKVEEPEHSDDIDQEDEEEDVDDEQSDEEMKMAYKIEFQPKQNAAPSNRGGNGAPSFVAMVQ